MSDSQDLFVLVRCPRCKFLFMIVRTEPPYDEYTPVRCPSCGYVMTVREALKYRVRSR
ncbi:MAG: hypothetical protein J7M38_06715 [Armatimonadetes bacterium]|nr:hypothetical protein [Armatimonadota bacterium]